MPSAIENNDEIAHLPWRAQRAKMLRSMRLYRGFSTARMAREIDKSRRQVFRIESGECEPTATVIDKWLMACGAEFHVEIWSKW